MEKREKLLGRKEVYQGSSFILREDTVKVYNGEVRDFSIVQHVGAVVIVPVMSDGSLLMVRQWRRAVESELLEFPAGTLEVGEAPLECAKRELIEETSHEASEWLPLGDLFPAPGFCSERQYCFLAKNLTFKPGELDEDEILEVQRITKDEITNLARSGETLDAKSLAVYFRCLSKGLI